MKEGHEIDRQLRILRWAPDERFPTDFRTRVSRCPALDQSRFEIEDPVLDALSLVQLPLDVPISARGRR